MDGRDESYLAGIACILATLIPMGHRAGDLQIGERRAYRCCVEYAAAAGKEGEQPCEGLRETTIERGRDIRV